MSRLTLTPGEALRRAAPQVHILAGDLTLMVAVPLAAHSQRPYCQNTVACIQDRSPSPLTRNCPVPVLGAGFSY